MPQSDFDQLSPYCVWFPGYLSLDPSPSLTNNVSSGHINATVMVDLDCPDASNRSDPLPPPTASHRIFTSIGLDLPGNVSTVAAVLCHPKYSITRRHVTTSLGNSTGGDVLDISSDVLEDMALGAIPGVLTYDILNSMVGYLQLTGEGFIGLGLDWRSLMNLTTPQAEWKAFTDTTLLSTGFQRTFNAIAAITVKYTKTVPATENKSVPGRIAYKTPRLVVAAASLRAVEALLAVSALVALLLCLVYNFKTLAERPPSLMTTAAVLAASSRLGDILCPDQVPRLDTLATNLGGYLFSSSPDLRTIHVQEDPQFDDLEMVQGKVPLPDDSGRPVSKWWRPAAATKAFRISLIATTLVLFVALEVLYQVSNKHGGIVDAATEGYTQYLWLYLPALAMAGLGLAYGSMDIAARTLHPFAELSKGKTGNKDAMHFDPRASTALVAAVQAFRRRFYGLSAIISTSLLAGLLTVASSGLYSATEFTSRIESVSLGLESWFDIESAHQKWALDDALDVSTPGALINQAIHLGNMSYPAGAYGEFAFAMPEMGSLEAYNTSEPPATLRMRVPAAQTRANCSLYRFWDSIELEANQSSYGFSLEVHPPPGCERGPPDGLSDGRYLSLANGAGRTPPPGYFGFVSGLWWKRLPNTTNPDGTYTPTSRTPYTVCSDNTQHLFMIYGRRIDLTMHNVTLLHCLPFVQAVEVEAEFTLPSLTINENNPSSLPTLSPNTPPTPWNSPTKSSNSIPLPQIDAAADSDANAIDSFFTVLTRGARGATPISALLGRGKTDAMIARVGQVYAQLGAQALNYAFRQPIGSLDASDGRPAPGRGRVEGVVSVSAGPGRGRLVQSGVATRVLEGLLLCLAVCGGVSFWVLRGTEGVLPVDPGSVAARMGLLVGSGLVERLRRDGGDGGEGAEGLEGERFVMGWWEREGEEKGEGGKGEDAKGEGSLGRWRYGIDMIPSSEPSTVDSRE